MLYVQIYTIRIIVFGEHLIGDRILVFVEHLIEGVVELAGDGVDLQLLPDDLVLQLVNPEVDLDDIMLRTGVELIFLEPKCAVCISPMLEAVDIHFGIQIRMFSMFD